jgi:hypothetical protein
VNSFFVIKTHLAIQICPDPILRPGQSSKTNEVSGSERNVMRIIKKVGEMQQAKDILEKSSMSILSARDSDILGIWLCCSI